MWPTATERQLLRLGAIVRVALLALAILAQTTMMQWGQLATTQPPHSQPSASSTTMLSHYDASAQLLLQRSAWSRCPQLHSSTSGVERALLHALSFQSHWDGQRTALPSHSAGATVASALSMLTIALWLRAWLPVLRNSFLRHGRTRRVRAREGERVLPCAAHAAARRSHSHPARYGACDHGNRGAV